ncbi:DUF2637 domain-containing protein [Streptosporangium sp. G12]
METATNNPTPAPAPTTPVRRPVPGGVVAAVAALSVVLVGIIAVAFRGSWTAHRDAALASHFDATGAALYPFAPDGLILIALIAALVLRHDAKARFYALSVVAVFTLTSFIVNHLHGLGTFAPNQASGLRPELDWPVVALIAGQLIGAIFFGSHLIVSSLRYLFPSTHPDQAEQPVSAAPKVTSQEEASTPQVEPDRVVETVLVHADPDPLEVARLVYGAVLDLGGTVGRDKLAKVCGISARSANRVRADVETDRAEQAQREAEEAAAAEAARLAEEKAREQETARHEAEPSAPEQRPAGELLVSERRAEMTAPEAAKPDSEQTDHELKNAILTAAMNGQHAISAVNGHGPAGGDV